MTSTINKNIQVGVGLRHTHFDHFEADKPINIDFFEVISENFINTRGRPFEILVKLREKFPICMHGVSLSIAGIDTEVNPNYLQKLKELIKIVEPEIVSDHLCFTGLAHSNLHNLLPFAYTKENLARIALKVQAVQESLGRPLVLENLSAYFSLKNSVFSEAEFLNELAERTGCGILLDINNLYVNSVNQNFHPNDFISKINIKHIKQIHLAGYTDFGDYLFDSHAHPVYPEVWVLFQEMIKRNRDIPVLVEWDEDIPTFERLEEEALTAKKLARN